MLQSFPASDGESIHVTIIGTGRPVIFLHGWTSNHREWLPYAEAIADTHRCYCWDARAHGGHELQTDHPPTVQRMAGDLQDLLDHFHLERAIVLGHSMGALTTWEYVRQFGCARLEKLVLVDQSPKVMTDGQWTDGIYGDFSHDLNDEFIRRLETNFSDAVLRLAAEGYNARAREAYANNSRGYQKIGEYLATLKPGPLIDIWKSLSLTDYRDVLPKITVPTLLVHGDESNFYSLQVADYVSRQIPDAKLHIYEQTDHSPHLWQKERFVADLRAFLSEPTGG